MNAQMCTGGGNLNLNEISYLNLVWKHTHPESEFEFTRHTLPVKKPKVPQQANGSDCGIFLLHFIEQFCERPEWDEKKVRILLPFFSIFFMFF